MRVAFISVMPVTLAFFGIVLLQGMAVVCSFPGTLKLERAFSHDDAVELSVIRNRDDLRHRRLLQQDSTNDDAIDFTLQGTYDPYRVGYFLN